MAHPIVYVDVSRIREGRLEQLETAMTALSGFVKANMPRVTSYGFYLNKDRTTMTVVAVHPDSASLEFHLDRGAAEFRKFAAFIELVSIDVYGPVTQAVVDRLDAKARILGSGTIAVHALHSGFARWRDSASATPTA